MAYKLILNPLTGLFDFVGGNSSSSTTDHHSGWKTIQEAQTVTVAAFKQMVVFGTLEQDGTLHVDGELILED